MAQSDEVPPSPARPADGIALVPLTGDRPVPGGAPSAPPARPADPAAAAPARAGAVLVLLVSLLALLLGSFPARNSDLWMHLAAGRRLVQGGPASVGAAGPGWLYDLASYGLYSTLGGAGLVFAKALLVVGVALVLLCLSRAGPGWSVPAFCTALALLAMGTRLLLQPATVSYLFLALTLWFLRERGPEPANRPGRQQAPWPLFVLFVVWVNVDGWFVLGLATVALVWLGRALDSPRTGNESVLRRLSFVLPLALLAAGCLLNPAHVSAFALPPELGALVPAPPSATGSASGPVTSPFQRAYFTHLGASPAGLAYFPLLGLSLLSFALALPRWSWQRLLPWLGLALLSAAQVRAVPFFAVVAGPVLARNLHSWAAANAARRAGARRASPGPGGSLALAVLGLVLVACAWPGWLQVPPFEPRRWAVETPPSLERGAATTRRWHEEGKLGPEARGLHLSAETAHAFAWFCPQERGLRDDALAAAVREAALSPADRAERLRSAGVTHVFLYDADRGSLGAALDNLLADPPQWPVLYAEGDLIVFGWRDPAGAGKADPFRDWQLDLNGLAFRPAEDKKAPRRSPAREPEVRPWWEAFWKPAAPRPIDGDEATLHLLHAEALRRSAPYRHQAAWQPAQAAALVGAAGGWAGPGGLLDAHRRLTFFRPLTPLEGFPFASLPPTDQLAHHMQQQFARHRDDTPPALLYLAVRAARRAVAANPDDAQAYLVLGEAYVRLLHSTRERVWAEQLPQLKELRRIQASAALNQAVSLKPDFPSAHFTLSRLYAEMDYLDLALAHLRAYQKLTREAAPPRGVSPEQLREQGAPYEEELNQLAKEVEKRENKHAVATAGWKVLDQAFRAWQDGLAGKARDLLLESDIAAFGDKGMRLELELLLSTGRPKTVLEWTGPEHEAALGASYHWLRLQALAAVGDYAPAEEEFDQLSRSASSRPQGRGAPPVRELMALGIAQRLLDDRAVVRSPAELMWRAFTRAEFRKSLAGLEQALRREADLTVLRGLLALEEGEVDRAESDFRVALTLWRDAAAAASGAGLDFNARAAAQGCLEWLE